jgi:hypothetical protein
VALLFLLLLFLLLLFLLFLLLLLLLLLAMSLLTDVLDIFLLPIPLPILLHQNLVPIFLLINEKLLEEHVNPENA